MDGLNRVELPLFEAIMEELADRELYQIVLRRMADKSKAVEVDIGSL